MRPPVDNGVILLTGASSGIGAAMATLLAPRASGIALVARRADRLTALAERLRHHPNLTVTVHPCDLTDLDATAAMVDAVEAAHGQVDVLINNAGLGDIVLFENSSWEKNRRMIDVNITALLFVTHRVLPGMVARGAGGICNVSSGFGLTWMPLFAAYVGTKHFVSGFSESLRCELAGTGVAVTHICPGPVATEFEAQAENRTAHAVPALVQISAEQCARQGLHGFLRGRALVVPGWISWFGITLGRMTPSWVLRRLYAAQGPRQRRRVQTKG